MDIIDSKTAEDDKKKDSEALWDQYINEGSPAQNSTQSKEQDSDKTTDNAEPNKLSSPVNADSIESKNFDSDKAQSFDYDENILPDDDVDIIDPVNLKLDDILQQLNIIQKEFNRKIKFDEQKNKIIDNLHQELQEHKNDILKKYLKTIVLDIIQFTDSIRKLTNFYDAKDLTENDTEKLLNLLKNIPSDLEDICTRQGINSFTCEGADFDPRQQRVLKKIETQEKDNDKKVAETIHPGYEWDGDIIRPEMVAVYDYIAPIPDTEMRNSDE